MDRKVRLGFVGVGNMGQNAHLKNYCLVPDCEVVAIAELRPGLARRVAQKYGIPHVYTNAAEMLESEQLDGLVAVQKYTRHGVILSDLYKAGIPILSEKPLAASVEVGEKLLQALAAGGSWHMVAYHKRSDPATTYAREQIERLKRSGELGAMRYVRLLMPSGDYVAGGYDDLLRTDEPYPNIPVDPPASDLDAQAYSEYVELADFYCHQINLLRYLLGEPYRVVFADQPGVLLVGRSDSGVTVVLEMSPYQTSIDWQESALVAFEHGYIKLDLPAPLAANRPGRVEVFVDRGKGTTPTFTVPQFPWVSAMRQQAINFVRAIRGEGKPPCEAAEALEDLKVAREYLRLWKNV